MEDRAPARVARPAVETYGSAYHLATLLGVELAVLWRWCYGEEPVPVEM